MDANLMHISYESGILENPSNEAPKDLYLMTSDPTNCKFAPIRLEIGFLKGRPSYVKSSEKLFEQNIQVFEYLNKVGRAYGIGRIDIVENRYIGLKVL